MQVLFSLLVLSEVYSLYRSIDAVPISEEKVINNNVSSVIIDTNNVRVNINPTTGSNVKVKLDGEVNPNVKKNISYG